VQMPAERVARHRSTNVQDITASALTRLKPTNSYAHSLESGLLVVLPEVRNQFSIFGPAGTNCFLPASELGFYAPLASGYWS
jgi:hypothetical protein